MHSVPMDPKAICGVVQSVLFPKAGRRGKILSPVLISTKIYYLSKINDCFTSSVIGHKINCEFNTKGLSKAIIVGGN
jgi:hypothetical protein